MSARRPRAGPRRVSTPAWCRPSRSSCAGNDDAKGRISRIIGQVASHYEAMRPHLNDPATLNLYQRFLSGKLDELRTVLDDAKVDAAAREKILAAFRDDYDGIGAPPASPGLAGVSVGGVDVDAVGWEPG